MRSGTARSRNGGFRLTGKSFRSTPRMASQNRPGFGSSSGSKPDPHHDGLSRPALNFALSFLQRQRSGEHRRIANAPVQHGAILFGEHEPDRIHAVPQLASGPDHARRRGRPWRVRAPGRLAGEVLSRPTPPNDLHRASSKTKTARGRQHRIHGPSLSKTAQSYFFLTTGRGV